MKNVKILFADDHSIVRNGLRALFRSTPGFSVVGEAPDGEKAVELASLHTPDIAILDISMPKLNGIEAMQIIKQQHPGIKILMLTIHEDEAYVDKIIRAGANGYVVKNAEKKDIIAAVKAVVAGQPFFSQGISKLIVGKFIRRAQRESASPPVSNDPRAKHERPV
ncbi:MAG TPA: response regulator transcription factor [Bacteroidota bacterium]|jgi:two-component system response regulator DegU|nr:response regulator transcription factor [Bacteroidota bacterium]